MKAVLRIFLLFIFQFSVGQNPYFNTINKSQGLLSNSVYDIFQDKNHTMWFATEKGLCNFNGYTFQYFSQNEMTSKAGSCIQQDKFGRIWYENFDGYLYYIENNSLKKLNQKKSIGYFKFGLLKDQLYVINEKAIDIYDLKKLQLKKSIAINAKEIKTLFFNEDTIYIFTDKLIVIKNDKIQNTLDFPIDFLDNFNSILVEKSKNGLLIASKFTKYYYHFVDNKFHKKELNISNTIIQNLSWCNNKNWLCTTNGIIELDVANNSTTEFFNGNNISYIYKTKNNNFWISTLTEGLFFIEDFNTNFISSNESLTSVYFGNNELFIGTKNDKIYSYQNNKLNTIYTGKENHQIGQLFFDSFNQQLFFTSSKFGLLNKNKKLTKELAIAVKNSCAIDQKYISFAASSSSGLFKTNNTIQSEWDIVFSTFNQNKNLEYNNIILNAKGKATAYNNKYKVIYYATNNGLYGISTSGKIFELKLNNKSLIVTKLTSSKDKIYACNNDLNIYEIQNQSIKEITLDKNLDKESVEKYILKENLLFIITNKYIFEYNLSSKKLRQIIHINNNIEVNDIVLKNNNYYISADRGLIIKKMENYFRPNPFFKIEALKVNNKNIDSLRLNDLAYDENNIQIKYQFLSPTPFEDHDLIYRINNSPWQKANILNTEIVLNSLNYGAYTIEFVLNSDYKNSKKINFTINRPFWLQFPFILCASLLLIGFAFWLYRKNITKIEKRNQLALDKINLEKNVNQSKLKAIKSQMNPHFFYNALNTLQSYILSNEKKEAIEYLSKFSNLTRTILEMTEKDWITISDEIKTLTLYLDIEKARFEDDLFYTIKVTKEIDAELTKIPSMLIQPYVENAIKHGLLHKSDKKNLTIEFSKIEEFIEIIIDDNGIGRQKSNALNQIKNKNHQSFATNALQNRIDLLNQYNQKNISIEIIDKYTITEQPSGTTVKIKIPIEQ